MDFKKQKQTVLQELLEYFYYHQYEHEYYPAYDMVTEYDYNGNKYNMMLRVD